MINENDCQRNDSTSSDNEGSNLSTPGDIEGSNYSTSDSSDGKHMHKKIKLSDSTDECSDSD